MDKELIERRTANSKTFALSDGKRRLVVSIGDIHYKDNYADTNEQWKDIDLTWEGNRITKAPYELTRDGNKLTIRDKKSGEISTIELVEAKPVGLKWEIIPDLTRVNFRHILPPNKIPFEAKFKVTGKMPFTTRASDDEGELELETSLVDGILTEKLSEVKDKRTGLIRPAKGNIRIDPTYQPAASSDDCHRILEPDHWSLTSTYAGAGGAGTGAAQLGCGIRFPGVAVDQGAIIDDGTHLTLRAKYDRALTTVNSKISAEDVDSAITFADDKAAFDTRFGLHTTARVTWNNIGAWTTPNDYNSSEIKTVIKEIVDRGGWASGQDIVIFWEDFDGQSTDDVANNVRQAESFDGSEANAPKLVIVIGVAPTFIPTVTII